MIKRERRKLHQKRDKMHQNRWGDDRNAQNIPLWQGGESRRYPAAPGKLNTVPI